jgi:AsmA protein
MVTDAVLTTSDLNATLPFMALNGGGTVNLLNDEIDFDVTASFVDGPVLQSDPAMARMLDQRLPLNVGGTLGAPSILPDFGAMVREELEEEVDEAVEEEKEELEQELEQERDEAVESFRDRLRRRLEQ